MASPLTGGSPVTPDCASVHVMNRLETALSSRTVAELAALTADLLAGGPVGAAAAAGRDAAPPVRH